MLLFITTDIVCTLIRVDLKEQNKFVVIFFCLFVLVVCGGFACLFLGFSFVCKVILLHFLAWSQNLVGITVGNKVVQMQTSHILLSTIVIRTNNPSVCLPEVTHCG